MLPSLFAPPSLNHSPSQSCDLIRRHVATMRGKIALQYGKGKRKHAIRHNPQSCNLDTVTIHDASAAVIYMR